MIYPYLLLCDDVKVKPVIRLDGCPLFIALDEAMIKEAISMRGNSEMINDWFNKMISDAGHTWAVGAYLENREGILSYYSHMSEEKRYFHLGVDICAPAGTPVYAPLDSEVFETGYEEGEGNYGGYVILKHIISSHEPFYTIYGHMKMSTLPEVGKKLSAGDRIAEIGDLHENGGWNHHTHIQVITEKGRKLGFFFKGYCNEGMLKDIESICPNPMPLLVAGNTCQ